MKKILSSRNLNKSNSDSPYPSDKRLDQTGMNNIRRPSPFSKKGCPKEDSARAKRGPIWVVGINGSPHKNGKTAKLLKKILAFAKKAGGEIKLIHLVDYEIKYCLGCYSIDPKNCVYPCRIKDDMQKLYELLEKTDAMVLGSPVYWFNMSGLMKNFIDRLISAENNNFLCEGKVACLVTSREAEGGMMAAMSMASALNHMGFILLPYVIYYPANDAGENWIPPTTKWAGKKLVEIVKALRKINWKE